MNRTTLKQVGEVLWGPQYRSEMARQLDVSLRTVMRWDGGETATIPQAAADRLVELLKVRQARIALVLRKIEVSS